ncbi:hypothetical protein [Aeoliella mucimassa]|uniref:Arrestin-like N-terminal domain-containing protein n=1 Tax=Aeoliella mucimassa TaxID=2527972 RepID=A0A518ALL1_9BACT|nr:hypothetical protein [Aeoliella mucimassa]QDU55574.1 hypothetical protein Pan181_17660 [Aeoliella mucimassa]
MRVLAANQSPLADIRITDAETPFAPGDVLRGSICVNSDNAQDVRSAELSVLWYTAGKGEEDFGVHYFQRYSTDGPDGVELTRRREFRTLLPENPLSYDGIVVKVCWCARLRLFLPKGRQQVLEASFQLGNVAPARLPTLLSPDGDEE